MKDAPNFGPGWGAVWVAENAKLPESCCTCDAPCQRTVTISSTLNYTTREERRAQADDDAAVPKFIGRVLFGVLFVWVYQWLTSGSDDQAGAVTVKVKMRQCKPCSRNLHLEPQSVDYDYYKMRFVVSKKFVEVIEKANA